MLVLMAEDCCAVVDKALKVVEKYHDRLTTFERDTLLKPEMGIIRSRKSLF